MKYHRSFIAQAGLAVLLFTVCDAITGFGAEAESRGFSADRLQRIHAMIRQRIDAKILSGAVALVSRDGHPVYFEAQGLRDLESKQPMEKDAHFRIYSMTKPVIGVAILMLVEEGKIRLSDPVSRFIPELKSLRVAVTGKAPAVVSIEGNATAQSIRIPTEPAIREITVRDLLTHTSGFGSGRASNAEISKLNRKPEDTLATFIPRLAAIPLEFQPGTKWSYSGGVGFDTLGRIVEVVSGQRLQQFLQERLFGPLDMTETTFAPSPEQKLLLATIYRSTVTGLVKEPDQQYPINPVYPSGGAGLVSTVQDYFHFAEMLNEGGQFRGRRILSPRMVEIMRAAQVPDTFPGRSRGESWGLSVRVIEGGAGDGSLLSGGTFGWSGAIGTHFWIDPKEKIVAVFMTQWSNAGGAGAETARAFETAVMQSLVELN
jgi:CubicO group peptidase (beta-lactamase class C family)